MSGQETDAAALPATRARSLRATRTAALAARSPVASAPSAPGIAYLVCACGSERYGLPLSSVAQVLPMRHCTPVPGAGPALVGLIGVSGRVIGVVGLARALGLHEAAAEGGHLVVLRRADPVALAVDRVIGLSHGADTPVPAVDGPDRALLGSAAASGYVPAGADDGSPDFVIIDLPRLLRRTLT